jgi:Rrf2 family protein
MLDLVEHYSQGPIPLKDVAERQDISEKYLWQVINPLKAAGLIIPIRGAHGGYVLARKPREISVRDIIIVLEGPLALVECMEKKSRCRRIPDCMAHDMWVEIGEKLDQTLREITLADIVERFHARRLSDPVNYSI